MKKDEFKKWVQEHEDEIVNCAASVAMFISGIALAYIAGENSVYKQMQAECRQPILIKHVIHKR